VVRTSLIRSMAVLLGLGCGVVQAAPTRAVVVAVGQTEALPAELALVGIEQRAESLVETLKERGGISDVHLLTGASATRAAVVTALQDSLRSTASDAVILWIFEGHGVGGDYGDPHLLAVDSHLDQLATSAVEIGALTQSIQADIGARTLFVLLDVSHSGAHVRTALIGPSVDDWPTTLPSLGVVSASGPGESAPVGTMLPVLRRGLEGAADTNSDQQITWGELSNFLVSGHGDQSLKGVRAAGGIQGDKVLINLKQLPAPPEPTPTPTPPLAQRAVPWRAISWGLLVAGGVSGATSVGMYAAKRGTCSTQGGITRCGSGEEYARYQRTQHALGWVGGGLIAVGAGLRFTAMDDSFRVRFGGRF
jgi:hypothetical protein